MSESSFDATGVFSKFEEDDRQLRKTSPLLRPLQKRHCETVCLIFTVMSIAFA